MTDSNNSATGGTPLPGGPPAPLFAGAAPGSNSSDTTFFRSRGAKQLMVAPMKELLAISERLVSQAQALGREGMVPDLQKIATAARHLIEQFNRTQSGDTIVLRLSPMLESLTERAPVEAPAAGHPEAPASDMNSAPQAVPTTPAPTRGTVLLVDDDTRLATIIGMLLEHQGYETRQAATGEIAIQALESGEIDLVLLDILLPEVNGFQVLSQIRSNPKTQHIPVIMVSGLDDMQNVVRSVEMGADDYLPKPINPVLLRARIENCMEKKRLRDQQDAYLLELQTEREKSDRLLLNVLPAPIATRLKRGEKRVVDSFPEVTVLFADIAGFTELSSHTAPSDLVDLLNEVFSTFDRLAEKRGLEKIKTIGDAYMLVGGLPTPRPDHAEAVADMALDMVRAMEEFNRQRGSPVTLRIGIHTGPVIAGIIGRNKFAYDLWGSTVNLASRMESQGQVGSIQITEATRQRLRGGFSVQERGRIEVKGFGEMNTFLLLGKA